MLRSLNRIVFSLSLTLWSASLCLAQAGGEEEGPKSYVASYFIVGLGITLGLLAICKSAGRRKEVKKPE